MQSDYLIELNEQNFQSVLEGSFEKPVLIYFWAQRMPESAEHLPWLKQLAAQYGGAFTLALLECEQQQLLAAQFGVRALPTLALFNQGQAVDGLAGPQTEATIKEMLERHLPNQDEMQLSEAQLLISQENYPQALVILKNIEASLGERGEFKLALASCYVAANQFDLAETVLATVLMQDQDTQYRALIAKIELHKQAADTPEIRELQQAHAQDPSNLQCAYELAIALNHVNKAEEALALLLTILRKELNFAEGNAKKTMMDILAALGQGNEIASRYRRQLYALLY